MLFSPLLGVFEVSIIRAAHIADFDRRAKRIFDQTIHTRYLIQKTTLPLKIALFVMFGHKYKRVQNK